MGCPWPHGLGILHASVAGARTATHWTNHPARAADSRHLRLDWPMVCPQQQAVAGHNYFGECVLSSYACACVDAQHLLRIFRHHDTACGNASTDWPAATVVNPREVFTSLQGLSGPHVALVIVGTFLFVLTSAFMILTALLVVDRRPDPTGKKNLLSASHGTYNLRNMSAAAYCYHYCSSTQYCSRRLHPIALGHTGTLYTSTHAHA